MIDRVPGFNLTKEELSIESGEGASTIEINKYADLISMNWKQPKNKPNNQTLLLLSGFQGSGKTTTIELLNQNSDFLIISPDEIRHHLFSSGYEFSNDFVILVNAVKFELVKRALKTGYSAILDQSLTPDRVKLTEKIVKDYPVYQIKSVFLNAPVEVLRKRVLERPQLTGRYKGKINELEGSIQKYQERYGNPVQGGYDLIVDTIKNDPQKIVSEIEMLFL